ncbi:MAG: antibiotic biosynthesis monooxygenase [Nitrospirae bacterium]|nr:MAG: antibiotic biosynthesis monooxygenase [Nitrospirota bacterium]
MIHVLASIRVKASSRNAFIDVFKANVAKVRAEKGCIEYIPATDAQTDITVQHRDACVVTIIEKWQSVEALKAHLAVPHMIAYKEAVKDMVESVEVKILQEV